MVEPTDLDNSPEEQNDLDGAVQGTADPKGTAPDDSSNEEEQRPLRLVGDPDYEKFMIRSQMERVSLLRQLQKEAHQFSAYYSDETGHFLLTSIIHVDPKRDMLIMERSGDEKANQRLLEADHVLFDTKHNHATTQFVASDIQAARLKGEPVFLMPLPTEVLRLQRREAFRAPVPQGIEDKAICTISDIHGEQHTLDVQDISIGGIGLVDHECAIEVERFQVVEGAELYLPEQGTMHLNLEIRGVFDTTLTNSRTVRRVGCAFHNLRGGTESRIQRYIHKLEVERRNK
ncbi:MAG: flagellar brake protein [Pseudomonadota bacterium]